MQTLQQQKDQIDKTAFDDRQKAADDESERIRAEAEAEIKQIQYDAQK